MNQYDHLKNKLQNYKVEIDKEKLWAKTSHAIPQRKRRRAVLIMFFGTLAVSAWLLSSTLLVPTNEQSLTHSNKSTSNSLQAVQKLPDNTTDNKNEWKETPHKTIEVLSSKLSRSVANITEALKAPAEENFSNPVDAGENTPIENNVNQIKNAKISGERNPKVQNDISITIHSQNERENIPDFEVHSTEPLMPGHIEGFPVITQFGKSDYSENNVTYIEPVDYLFKVVSPIPITENSELAASSLKPDIRPLKGRFLQSLQMVQGIGFSTVKIHSLTPEAKQYATLLEAKLRSLEVMTTTVSADFNLPARFSLGAGLQFSRLSTVIDHEWEIDERIQEEGVTTIIIDENGIPQSVTGNRDVTRTTHYKAKRFSTHQNIDFVLSLQRVIWNEQRISMNAFIKGAYNFSYEAKGTMLDSNGELVSFSKEENPFRKDSPFAFGGGFQMRYQLHPHWSLAGNLTFDALRYKLKDENMPVRFIYSGWSFGLGLAYIL